MLRGTPQPTKEPGTQERLEELRQFRDWLRKWRGLGLLIVGGGSVLVLSFLPRSSEAIGWWLGVIGLAVVLTLWLLYYFSPADIEQQIRSLEVELEILNIQADQANAYRLFQLHQFELDKYYRHTLHSNRVLMCVGLACLAVGLGIVLLAGWRIAFNATGNPSDMLVAGLGAVGGILANYVAAVYLKMNAVASQALNDFHNRLVSTHHLHFGHFLASGIHDPATLEATLKEMASQLARR